MTSEEQEAGIQRFADFDAACQAREGVELLGALPPYDIHISPAIDPY